MRAFVAAVVLALLPVSYAAAFEPPPERLTSSPRQLVVQDATLPVALHDAWGNPVPPAPAGATQTSGGVVLHIPRLIPGVYTMSWDAGSTEVTVEGDMYAPSPEIVAAAASSSRPSPQLLLWVAVALLVVLLVLLLVRRRPAAAAAAAIAAGAMLLAAPHLGAGDEPDLCSGIARYEEMVTCMVSHVYGRLQADGPEGAVATMVGFASVPSSPWRAECHELMHMLGEAAWQLFPDVERLVSAGSVDCRFGFFHGMLEAMGVYTETGVLPALLADTCRRIVEQHGDSYEVVAGCAHGSGHAAMWRTGADLLVAAETCAAFEMPREQDECLSGAVMEWGRALRRAEDLADESSLPHPRVSHPFDLCFEPFLEPTAGCFGGAVLGVSAAELIPSVGRCVGLGLQIEFECRNYALVALRNFHSGDEPRLLSAVAELCRDVPWEDGPEPCYANFGFHVMEGTISPAEVERVCGKVEEDFLAAACVTGGIPR